MAESDGNWGWVKRQVAWRLDGNITEIVLKEVERRIREMQPAPQSPLTFDGGRNRALRMVRDMKKEVTGA